MEKKEQEGGKLFRQWDDKEEKCHRPMPPKGRGQNLCTSNFASEVDGYVKYSDTVWEEMQVK